MERENRFPSCPQFKRVSRDRFTKNPIKNVYHSKLHSEAIPTT